MADASIRHSRQPEEINESAILASRSLLKALRDRVRNWQWRLALRRASARQWVFCTVATRSFLPQARVLFDSLRAVHPEARLLLLFVGRDRGDTFLPEWTDVNVVGVRRLVDEEEERRLRRRYTIAELCFALKPRLLLHAIDRIAERAVYLDSDIFVYSRFDEVFVTLERSSIALTPHLDTPLPDDGMLPSDMTILRSGSFNLGFVAATASAGARAVLEWWDRRVRRWGFVAPEAGYQGDQKWMDLAASMFPGVAVVRDPGCNVAYWNLHSRSLAASGGAIAVQGAPLVFFHFSGNDPAQPERLSRFTNRIRLDAIPVAKQLLQDYALRVSSARSGMAPEAAPGMPGRLSPAGTVARHLLPAEAYRASIAIDSISGVFETSEEVVLQVTVTNVSPFLWPVARSDDGVGGIFLSWHFRSGSKVLVQWDNPRFALGGDLAPGGRQTIEVSFRAPGSCGKYILEFDLLHEGFTWFSEHGSQPLNFELRVGVSLEDGEDHSP